MSRDTEETRLLDDADGRGPYEASDSPSAGAPNSDLDATLVQEKRFVELLLTIFPMFVGTFLATMDGAAITASYPLIGSDLEDLKSTAWLSTGYMVTLTSFQPLYGKLCDIFGRKPCLLAAYAIFAFGSLGCGMARTMPQLIAARCFSGIGGGGMSTIVSIVISDLVPVRSRGTWHSVLKVISSFGSIIGGPLGGFLADTIGWRWCFLFQVPMAGVAFIAVMLFLRIPGRDRVSLSRQLKRVDFTGSFCLVIGLAALLMALNSGGDKGWKDPWAIWAFVVFIAFTILLVIIEKKIAKEPVAPSNIITSRSLRPIFSSNFAARGCSMCTVFFISLYVQAVRKRTSTEAGVVLLSSPLGDILGSVFGGLLIQMTGRLWWSAVGAHTVMLIGSLIISFFTVAKFSTAVLYSGLEIGIFLVQAGRGLAMTTTLVALVAKSTRESIAVSTAVMYLFRSLGSVISLAAGSALFQASLQNILRRRLPSENIEKVIQRVRESLRYIDELPAATADLVRGAYDQALQRFFFFCNLLALIALLCSSGISEESLSRAKYIN